MTLTLLCALAWLNERRELASLMLCVLGVGVAATAFGELCLMRSTTTAEYGEWIRWYHVPVFLVLAGQLLFVHYYLGTGRLWLLWAFIFSRAVILAVNFSVHPNFNFSEITSLDHVSLFGEQVSTLGDFVRRGQWQWLAAASGFLFIAYLIDAAVRRWLKGGKDSGRKALTVSLGITIPMTCMIVFSQLVLFGFVPARVPSVPWFLGAQLVMAYELGRDLILSRRERLELAELRNRLAQVDRVSVLGQLSSALAHELSQPLAATAANVNAGLVQLEAEKPDLEELRAILHDIGRDDRRASEIINRMRQLFRRRTIEMQPVGMEDVIQDVVSLVQSEANAKLVKLHVIMQPGLPRVSGDRVHLSQVLLNLVVNSIDAVQSCPPGARYIIVEARATHANSEVEMAVKDSGPGIPKNVLDQIFQPFFTTKSDGTGIGLALSRTIIEAHGGRLWCDDVGQQDGATFRLTLRQAPSPEHSVSKDRYSSPAREGSTREAPA